MSTLADLYDPLTMPALLAKAHAELDRAVERCYRKDPFTTDRERVEHLFRLYEQLTAPLIPPPPRSRGRKFAEAVAGQKPRRFKTPILPPSAPPGENSELANASDVPLRDKFFIQEREVKILPAAENTNRSKQ